MFDDIIKGKANEHEAPVPPDAWDNIIKKKKRKRFAFWWWGSGLLLLLGTTGYFLLDHNKKDTIVSQSNNGQKNNPGGNIPIASENKDRSTQTATGATSHTSSITKDNTAINEKEKKQMNTPGSATISISAGEPADDISSSAVAGNKTTIANKPGSKKIKGSVSFQQLSPATGDITVAEKAAEPVEEGRINDEEKKHGNNIPTAEEEKNKPVQELAVVTGEKKDDKKTGTKTDTVSKKNNIPLAKQTNKKHWFIDAGITPLVPLQQYDAPVSYSRSQLSNNNLTEYNAHLVKTTIDPSVAFAFTLRRELSKKLQAGIGLQYVVLKENISIEGNEKNTEYTIVQRLVNGSNGPEMVDDTITAVTEGTRTIEAVNSYHLYSIPVFIQYSFVQQKKWNLSATLGTYINIAGTYYNEINNNTGAPLLPVTASSNETNIGCDVFAGLRFGKVVSNRIELFAAPAVRWSISNYNFKNSLINRNTRQACVGFGLSYKIN